MIQYTVRINQVLKFSKATQQMVLQAKNNIHKKPCNKLNLCFMNNSIYNQLMGRCWNIQQAISCWIKGWLIKTLLQFKCSPDESSIIICLYIYFLKVHDIHSRITSHASPIASRQAWYTNNDSCNLHFFTLYVSWYVTCYCWLADPSMIKPP